MACDSVSVCTAITLFVHVNDVVYAVSGNFFTFVKFVCKMIVAIDKDFGSSVCLLFIKYSYV